MSAPEVDFGVRYSSERVGLGGAFWDESPIGRARLEDRAAYLWLAHKANHPDRPMKLDGLTLTVARGSWFCSLVTLAEGLGTSRTRVLRILRRLETMQAIEVTSVQREQRYRNETVNGPDSQPLNGPKLKPQRSGNRTDVRSLGTLIKVHGWREIASRPSNGIKMRSQVVLTTTDKGAGRSTSPRRSAEETYDERRKRENAETLRSLERERARKLLAHERPFVVDSDAPGVDTIQELLETNHFAD